MIVLYIILLVIPVFLCGILLGLRLRSRTYHGVIKMVENEGSLVYTLELVSDPELLIYQDEVRFKVVPPNYEDLREMLRDEN